MDLSKPLAERLEHLSSSVEKLAYKILKLENTAKLSKKYTQ
jgi:hypothetical protein